MLYSDSVLKKHVIIRKDCYYFKFDLSVSKWGFSALALYHVVCIHKLKHMILKFPMMVGKSDTLINIVVHFVLLNKLSLILDFMFIVMFVTENDRLWDME